MTTPQEGARRRIINDGEIASRIDAITRTIGVLTANGRISGNCMTCGMEIMRLSKVIERIAGMIELPLENINEPT